MQERPRRLIRPTRHASKGGTKADHVAEPRRIPQRPAQITAIRDRQHAARERHSRTTAAPATGFGSVIRIERRTEDVIEGLGTRTKLRGIGFADRDGSSLAQSFHDQGILLGHEVLKDAGAKRCADALGQHQILMRDGQAMEGADRVAASQSVIGGARCRHRLVRQQGNDRVHLGVHPLDLRQMRDHDLTRRHIFRANALGKFCCWPKADFLIGHAFSLPPGTPAPSTQSRGYAISGSTLTDS